MRHFFLRSQYIESVPGSFEKVHETLHRPIGKAFFCPICAEVWAQIPVDSEETYVEHIICDKHDPSPSRPYPGSLFLPWDDSFTKDLPTALLVREFILMYDRKEKSDAT